jgi:tetratricopeptide (TPR) repeat protein
VLAGIDGVRDIRELSTMLARSEFDVAKIVYGLLSTGVIELKKAERPSVSLRVSLGDPAAYVHEARRAMREGRYDAALEVAREGVAADPQSAAAHLAVADALTRLGRMNDAADALRVASEADPLDPAVQRARGVAALFRGDFDEAIHAWGRFLELAPTHAHAERVRAGLESVARLRALVETLTSD